MSPSSSEWLDEKRDGAHLVDWETPYWIGKALLDGESPAGWRTPCSRRECPEGRIVIPFIWCFMCCASLMTFGNVHLNRKRSETYGTPCVDLRWFYRWGKGCQVVGDMGQRLGLEICLEPEKRRQDVYYSLISYHVIPDVKWTHAKSLQNRCSLRVYTPT